MNITQKNLYEVFAENVKIRRIELKLSQTKLAERMNTSAGFVCDYEKGRRNPTLLTVQRFSEALECTASKLLAY
jgi:transcriptional regulator with XRE-family HTH domain